MIFTGVSKLYINMKEWATKMEMKKRAKYICKAMKNKKVMEYTYFRLHMVNLKT